MIDPHHKWLLDQITERFLAAEAVKEGFRRWRAGDAVGLWACGRVRVACYTMTLRLREGDFPRVLEAAAAADAACRDGEEPPFGSWTQVQISAALALLTTGDAEGAAERLRPVLDLPPEMRLATFSGKLARAGSLASAPPYRGSQAARTLAEEVRGYLGQDGGDVMPYPLALGSGDAR